MQTCWTTTITNRLFETINEGIRFPSRYKDYQIEILDRKPHESV